MELVPPNWEFDPLTLKEEEIEVATSNNKSFELFEKAKVISLLY